MNLAGHFMMRRMNKSAIHDYSFLMKTNMENSHAGLASCPKSHLIGLTLCRVIIQEEEKVGGSRDILTGI